MQFKERNTGAVLLPYTAVGFRMKRSKMPLYGREHHGVGNTALVERSLLPLKLLSASLDAMAAN